MPKPVHTGKQASPARVAAVLALMAIENEGRWANAELPPGAGPLSELDRALATALIAGVTRWRLALDHRLQAFLKTPLSKLPSGARNALRLGLFQLKHQERIPPHAAVDEAVRLARHFGHEGLAKLTNGVLRAIQREAIRGAAPTLEEDPIGHLLASHGIPSWLGQRWLDAYGPDEALALARHANTEPELWLRPNALRQESGASLGDRLHAAGLQARPHPVLGHMAWGLKGAGAITQIPGHAEGLWAVQDPAAMAVGLALAPQAGEKVADVGAAPGGKTAHLAALMQGRGSLMAIEAQASRMGRLHENLQRLGAHFVTPQVADGRNLQEWGPFDRILVDAPCSGLGVLARKADLRHRRQPQDFAPLALLQGQLLDGAALALKPGGVLVYATCTIAPEENEEVVNAFLARHPGFQLKGLADCLPEAWSKDVVDGGMMQWWPHRHDTDGFFVARMVAPGEGT